MSDERNFFYLKVEREDKSTTAPPCFEYIKKEKEVELIKITK